MSSSAGKFNAAIAEATAELLSRCANARGVSVADIEPRIKKALDKYLFAGKPDASRSEISRFIEEIRCDDLCLVLACEKGDEKAWEDMVANFDATVKSAARKISSNNEDAEDLASSIWAELYGLRQDADGNKKSKLGYYSGRGSLGGWLRAVVSQLAIDAYRKQSRLVQIEEDREFENLANEAAHSENGLVSNSPDPEALFAEKQTAGNIADALQTAIGELGDEDRLILKLYYFEGSKLKDISAMFGFHEATASRKLTRLQNDIRKGVEKHLREKHGWSQTEVGRHLSEEAEKLGISFEKMLAALIILMFVQDFII